LGLAAGLNLYTYVNNNPVNTNDPTGKWAGADDLIFTVGGGLVGVGGQVVSNLIVGKGLFPANSGRDYTAAFIGGAVGGEALLYSPVAGPAGPYLAGAAGGLANNVTKQVWNAVSQPDSSWDLTSTAFDTGVGALTGLVGGVEVPGLSAGRNSFNAIFEQMTTKFQNGTISNVTTQTASKMFVGASTDAATPVVSSATSLLDEGYDWAKDQLGFGAEPAATTTPTTSESGSSPAGSYLLNPNQSLTGSLQLVYGK
jgi:hypothetical protein